MDRIKEGKLMKEKGRTKVKRKERKDRKGRPATRRRRREKKW